MKVGEKDVDYKAGLTYYTALESTRYRWEGQAVELVKVQCLCSDWQEEVTRGILCWQQMDDAIISFQMVSREV